MELENENVQKGVTIGNNSYKKLKKDIKLLDYGVLDAIALQKGEIIEIKKSSKLEHLHIIQVGAYLEWLELYNVDVKKATIKYPKEKKTTKVTLTPLLKDKLTKLKTVAQDTLSLDIPPHPIKISACKQCAYLEFCHE